jgi:hypothetical protein
MMLSTVKSKPAVAAGLRAAFCYALMKTGGASSRAAAQTILNRRMDV